MIQNSEPDITCTSPVLNQWKLAEFAFMAKYRTLNTRLQWESLLSFSAERQQASRQQIARNIKAVRLVIPAKSMHSFIILRIGILLSCGFENHYCVQQWNVGLPRKLGWLLTWHNVDHYVLLCSGATEVLIVCVEDYDIHARNRSIGVKRCSKSAI